MRNPSVLFVSHPQKQCGVYQFGRNVATALNDSVRYRYLYRECADKNELMTAIRREEPAAVVYNYYFTTLPWLTEDITGPALSMPQIGIFHEVTQTKADAAGTELFDYFIAPDPTLVLNNPRVFKTGRLVPEYTNKLPKPEILTVGCFGFGTMGKGFDRVITEVQREFDDAVIRLHMPFAAFGDADGSNAVAFAKLCRELIVKPGIELRITHEFLTQDKLLDFLGSNSINCFFYTEISGRGISSVIDLALAVRRPIAISRNSMFRNLDNVRPSICIEESSLRQILFQGVEPLAPYAEKWSKENLIRDYDYAITQILEHPLPKSAWRGTMIGKVGRRVRGRLGRIARRAAASLTHSN